MWFHHPELINRTLITFSDAVGAEPKHPSVQTHALHFPVTLPLEKAHAPSEKAFQTSASECTAPVCARVGLMAVATAHVAMRHVHIHFPHCIYEGKTYRLCVYACAPTCKTTQKC